MQFVAPEVKGSRCLAPQTAGQRRGWRRAELGLLVYNVSVLVASSMKTSRVQGGARSSNQR